jgi:spore photoproduct lyase
MTGRPMSNAKTTLAVVVAPSSKRRLQPIPPSADWRVDFAEGCPAHCQYCYLASSLAGPPVTRVYANLPEILDSLTDYVG